MARGRSKLFGLAGYGIAITILLAALVAAGHGLWRFATLPSEATPCPLTECMQAAGRANLVRVTDATYACDASVMRSHRGRRGTSTYALLEGNDGATVPVIAIFTGERAACQYAASAGRPEGILEQAPARFVRHVGDAGLALPAGPPFRLTSWGGRGDAIAQMIIAGIVASLFAALLLPSRSRRRRNTPEPRAVTRMRARAERASLGAVHDEFGPSRGEGRATFIGLWLFAIIIAAGIFYLVTAQPGTNDTREAYFILAGGVFFLLFFAVPLFGVRRPRLHVYERGFVWACGRRWVAARWQDVRALQYPRIRIVRAGVPIYQNHIYICLRDGRTVHLNDSLDRVTDAAALIEAAANPHLDA